jgi:phenylalanyl-tRNA synthetase beta chain
MRVPVRWLADYVSHPWTTDELGHRLTMSGLKVEAIERPGELWGDVFIGQVTQLEPHPTSKKALHIAHVHYGDGMVTVVTGAQNLYVGAKAPIVVEGGTIPFGPNGEPLKIEPRQMAGYTSQGMLCSARELGLGEDHSGILILPEDAPIGQPLASFLGEDVLDIETVSNRPDTLSMIGVAREVAGLVPSEVSLPDLHRLPNNIERLEKASIEVEIADPDLCLRYSALRVDGVVAVQSPDWLIERLESAGMRPINLLVDLTNYVMHEYGQPMHAFDASKLRGGKIVVRRAHEGEVLRTLDGVDRPLPPECLVIADGDRAVAIAGVMGGENSEISSDTFSLILESANFSAPSVRKTAQRLGLRTDASSRFEKGLPPESTVPALERYVQLLGEITGDPIKIARVSDAWPEKPEPRTVTLPARDLRRLLGIDVPIERAGEILGRLGFEVELDGDQLTVGVPFWRRVDIERSADLVEEVGRIVGFDEIPSTLPFRTLQPPAPSPGWQWEGRVRSRLLACGLNEAVTHTLTAPALMARMALETGDLSTPDPNVWRRLVPDPLAVTEAGASVEPVRLLNPASTDRQVMRVTLVPSLLDIVGKNLKHDQERVAFFEVARTFFPRGNDALAFEPRTLGIAASGLRRPRTWADAEPGPFTYFDIKGIVEAVLDEMQIEDWEVEPGDHPGLHPGRSATLHVAGKRAGYLGELHPEVALRFEIEERPTIVAEINLDALSERASTTHVFKPLPRFPSAHRDIAVTVDRDLAAAVLAKVVERTGGEILESARIFDVYQGPSLPDEKKSVAVELSLRSPERTLTQEEVDAAVKRIVDALSAEFGADLRD